MKRVAFIIILTIIIVAIVAIVVFCVDTAQQPPRTNQTQTTNVSQNQQAIPNQIQPVNVSNGVRR